MKLTTLTPFELADGDDDAEIQFIKWGDFEHAKRGDGPQLRRRARGGA